MRDFDSIKDRKMKDIENHLRHIYNKGYDDGLKDKPSAFYEKYENGLNDAWECARKLVHRLNGGYTLEEREEVFGEKDADLILLNNTASEAIAKVKAWEEKKKQDDDEIKIGDEVLNKWGTKGIVIEIAPQHNGATVYSVLWRNAERRCLDKSDWDNYEVWKKTGRHFPEIADVLRKMQEGEG